MSSGVNPTGGGTPPPPTGATPPPPVSFNQNAQDPWAQMFPTATPEQITQFKNGVIKMLNLSMQQEQQKALQAIRKMGKPYQ